MSLLSKKKNVFEQIAILKTANEIVINKDLLKNQSRSLLNNKMGKDPFVFLIDLLTVVSGSDSVNKSIKNIISNISKIDDTFKEKIKEEITNSIGGDKNNGDLPTNIKNGVKIHINKLDYNRDLFIPLGTDEHELYLSDYQKGLQELIRQPNTRLGINNILDGEFNPVDGNFTFFPKNTSVKFKDFLFNLVDDIKFNDPKNIITNTFSDLFNGKNLDKEEMIMNQQIDLVLDNISTSIEEDDSYYKFTNGQSELIQEKITTNYQFYNELGTDKVETTLSNSELLASVNKYDNFNSYFFTDIIKKITSKVEPQNKQSTSNGFLSKFLVGLKNNVTKNYILSPQVLLIYNMMDSTRDSLLDPIGDIKKHRNLIKCLIKSVINKMMSGLFEMLKKDLLKIVAGVAALYIKENADKYKKIIQSLFKKV